MQTTNSTPNPDPALNHPPAETWMAFLYGEAPSVQRTGLEAHLKQCGRCRAQVAAWRQSLKALDAWSLPPARARLTLPRIAVTWAAAAAVVLLAAGFAWGRMVSPQAGEIAALKSEVQRLSTEWPRQHAADLERATLAATEAASAEAVRLFADLARADEQQRATDRVTLAATLRSIESRLNMLRSELATVAINTQTTFEQTHQDLTRLASLNLPAGGEIQQPAERH